MKLVINKCFGGFGLSADACELLIKLGVPRAPYDEHNHGRCIEDMDHPESTNFGMTGERLESHKRFCGRYSHRYFTDHRNDPDLVQVVETLGVEANGPHARLAVVEIPDSVDWEIDEYDGRETVRERSRSCG